MAQATLMGLLLVGTTSFFNMVCDVEGGGPPSHPHAVKIAWLGATPSNLFDEANLDGAQAAAAKHGGTVDPFYSEFDNDIQLGQCAQAVESGEYDALIVLANSAEGIMPCVDQAAAAGLPVVAATLPIGPDLTTSEPQVPGQIGAVLTPASVFAENIGALAVSGCAGEESCEIVYLGGILAYETDTMILDSVQAVVAANPNLSLVAVAEGFYDQAIAHTVMQDILVDHPDIDMVISIGDQMVQGAEVAIAEAGLPAGSIKLIGAGTGAYAVEEVRQGRWYATLVALPFDDGWYAARMAIRAARDLPITDPGIDAVELAGLPPFMSAENVAEFEDFEPQWPG